jgi:hypothetical protein
MNSKSLLITGACIGAIALCGPTTAFAASKKAASPAPSASPEASAAASPAAKAPRAIPFRGTASAVDQSAKTFAIAGKESSRTFKATDKTTVTKEGQAATFADLADDTKVTGSYWKQADGTLELKSLKIGGKAEPKEDGKKSKKGDDATSPSPSPKK